MLDYYLDAIKFHHHVLVLLDAALHLVDKEFSLTSKVGYQLIILVLSSYQKSAQTVSEKMLLRVLLLIIKMEDITFSHR